MWCLRSTFHRLPLEPGQRHALQVDRHLPDLRQDQERLPDVSFGSGVWVADAGQGYGACDQVADADERYQQGVFRTEYGWEGTWLVFTLLPS